MQHIGIGLLDGMREQPVAHEAPVHIKKLSISPRAAGGGHADQASQLQLACFAGKLPHGDVFAQRPCDTSCPVARWPLLHAACIHVAREADARMRDGHATKGVQAMRGFSALRLEEFTSCRCGRIQIEHLHRGARRACGRLHSSGVTAYRVGIDQVSAVGRGSAAGQTHAGDRGHRSQRFAAKAQGAHPLQVVQARDLAGGVTGERKRQLFRLDATAIVAHHNATHTAFFDAQCNPRGARINRVFQQFLDHRGGAFHHFACGDLADQRIG